MPIARTRMPRLLRHAILPTAIVAVLVAAGCEPQYRPGRGPVRTDPSADGMPAWVNEPPLDRRYVYGVGTDVKGDRNRAIAEGRRDIARQLRIVIRGDEQEAEDVDLADEIPGSRPRVSIDHLELPGITVTKEVETTRCLYVQVALNREAWATSLRSRIDELDRAMRTTIEQQLPGPATGPVGQTARLYQQLMPLVTEREEKADHLRIAEPGAALAEAPITSATLRERLARVLDAVTVDIVADPALDSILPQLTASCANLGLRIAPGMTQPTLRLKLQLQTSALSVDGLERLDGTFQSTVLTGKDGQNLGGITIALRSSGLSDTVARDRLMRKILVRWAEYLDQDFVAYLTRM
jgi:hypothetical protein